MMQRPPKPGVRMVLASHWWPGAFGGLLGVKKPFSYGCACSLKPTVAPGQAGVCVFCKVLPQAVSPVTLAPALCFCLTLEIALSSSLHPWVLEMLAMFLMPVVFVQSMQLQGIFLLSVEFLLQTFLSLSLVNAVLSFFFFWPKSTCVFSIQS